MGVLVADCNECKTKNDAMRVSGLSVPRMKGNQKTLPFGYMLATCSRCEKPSIFVINPNGKATWEGVSTIIANTMKSPDTFNLSAADYEIVRFLPTSQSTGLPGHLPEDVLKAFQQGETNFELEGHEEAAATMYRRSLERALKFAHPEMSGALAGKIKALVKSGVLPVAMGDWANEIRIIGNDGAHDEEVSHDDLKAARMFCDSFLRYVITLPKEIDIRRSQPT